LRHLLQELATERSYIDTYFMNFICFWL